jgi:hypothetical protein
MRANVQAARSTDGASDDGEIATSPTDESLPRVLFVTPGREEYASDALLHGLRSILGAGLIDYPKCEILYRSCPTPTLRSVRGYGFTLYGLLDDLPMSRARVLERLRWREFDLVVFGDITNSFGLFIELLQDLRGTPVALIDGADATSVYPYAGKWWRFRPWWFLPRAHTRFPYFKRELTDETLAYRCFLLVPPRIAKRLPGYRHIHPFSFSIPAEKIVTTGHDKVKLFPDHIVDAEIRSRLGLTGTEYTFSSEEDYYDDLRKSRYGITTKRGGWDCLRHYEIAASGCVPCFRDLDKKPPMCAPHGLNSRNCVSYSNYDDLMCKISRVDDVAYADMRDAAIAWAWENSTAQRAAAFLHTLGFIISTPASLGAAQTTTDERVPTYRN